LTLYSSIGSILLVEGVVRIGTAAEQAGVNVQTLRYYERRGLLPRQPRRTSSTLECPIIEALDGAADASR